MNLRCTLYSTARCMNSKTRTRGTGKAPHILYFSGSTSVREEPVRTRKNPKRVSYCVHTLLRTNILRTQPSHLRSRLITVAYEGEVSQSAVEPKFWHALRAIGRAARRAPPALCLESAPSPRGANCFAGLSLLGPGGCVVLTAEAAD